MRILKAVFPILAVAIIMIFAAEPIVQAGSGLVIFPTEPDVRGGVKKKATFAAYQNGTDDGCELIGILRIRPGNSFAWQVRSASHLIKDDTACQDTSEIRWAISDFLNSPDVKHALLGIEECEGEEGDPKPPDCAPDVYVHVKRDFNGGVTLFDPQAAVADLELVLNDEVPDF